MAHAMRRVFLVVALLGALLATLPGAFREAHAQGPVDCEDAQSPVTASKVDDFDPTPIGSTLTYTITVSPIPGVTTCAIGLDQIDPDTTFQSISGPAWDVCGELFGPDTVGCVDSGMTSPQSFQIVVTVNQGATGPLINTAAAGVGPVTANGCSSSAAVCFTAETTEIGDRVPVLPEAGRWALLVLLALTGALFILRGRRLPA